MENSVGQTLSPFSAAGPNTTSRPCPHSRRQILRLRHGPLAYDGYCGLRQTVVPSVLWTYVVCACVFSIFWAFNCLEFRRVVKQRHCNPLRRLVLKKTWKTSNSPISKKKTAANNRRYSVSGGVPMRQGHALRSAR